MSFFNGVWPHVLTPCQTGSFSVSPLGPATESIRRETDAAFVDRRQRKTPGLLRDLSRGGGHDASRIGHDVHGGSPPGWEPQNRTRGGSCCQDPHELMNQSRVAKTKDAGIVCRALFPHKSAKYSGQWFQRFDVTMTSYPKFDG